LTGRTDLWDELAQFTRNRPLLGYGYGAFWTPNHILDVSETLYWGISSAHSAYLETVLNIGLAGAAVLALATLAGLWRTGENYWRAGDAGHGLIFGMLIFGLVEGISEAGMVAPSFSFFVTICGLCQLGFFSRAEPSALLPEPAGEREEGPEARQEAPASGFHWAQEGS
jgi:exopolysaccharide production protein ExoQ